MDKPWKINCDCALVLGDVHMDVAWAQAVLEHEAGNYDHVVWLGDFYDSRKSYPDVVSARATARFHRDMIERSNSTVLLGNHDSGYMESWSHARKFGKKIPLLNACSGFSNSHAIDISKGLTWEHWRKVQLFAVVNGWLASHAGVDARHFRPMKSTEENFSALWDDARSALELIQFRTSPLLACGYSRGGRAEVPGLTWSDWNCDFEDGLPIPQICGHSFDRKIRQIGKSFCVDTGQKSYAMISRDGTVQFKNLVKTVVSGTWVGEPAEIENDDHRVLARRPSVDTSLL